MEIILPGGLLQNGSVERQASFHPLTGSIEQACIGSAAEFDRPHYVTAVLDSVLDRIGNRPADIRRVADLCVADRQYLMLRLAAMLAGEQMWLKVDCRHCQVLFDVDVQRCDLPVKPAGQGFPFVSIQIKDWELEARVPTGADQACIVQKPEQQAMRQLLQDCICSVNGEPPGANFIGELCESDIEQIDNALDDLSPAVCNQLLVTCPECGREQQAELDHYDLGYLDGSGFYDEVHMLASHYHWSEAAILDLPQAKRRLYLGLINRSSGMSE